MSANENMSDKENINDSGSESSEEELESDVQKLYEIHQMVKGFKKENQNPKKPRKIINSKLVQQNCGLEEYDGDELVQQLGKLEKLTLGGLELESCEHIEWYSNVSHVYLQENKIKDMGDDWIFLDKLQFLVLYDNEIEEIKNINTCTKLKMLDVRNNKITVIDASSLPKSLQYLFIDGNPVQTDVCSLASHLPTLVQVDDEIITLEMRKEWNLPVSERDEATIKFLLSELKTNDKSCEEQIDSALKLHGIPERPLNRSEGHNRERYAKLAMESEMMIGLHREKMGQIADQKKKEMDLLVQSSLKRIGENKD